MKKVIFIMLALAMTAGVSAQQKGGNRDVDNIVGEHPEAQAAINNIMGRALTPSSFDFVSSQSLFACMYSRLLIYSLDMNFSRSTMNLRCVPSPSKVSPEQADTLNSIFFPSTFVTSAVAFTTSPIFEGFR